MIVHRALGVPAVLANPGAEPYTGGGPLALTDGLRASISAGDRRWQGFQGDDLAATIDLKKTQKISRLSAGCLQRASSRIFLPRSVEVAISSDGKTSNRPDADARRPAVLSPDALIKEFAAEPKGRPARFVRVHALNIGVCPEGHPGAGKKPGSSPTRSSLNVPPRPSGP